MSREWFSFGGVRCDDLGLAMLGYTMRPLPDQVVESVQVPGMDGAYSAFTGAYSQRQIVVRCALLSNDEINISDKLWSLKAWLAGKKPLILWDREAISFNAWLSATTDINNQVLWGEFQLVFTCDPVGVGVERIYPFGAAFTNDGNHDAPCVIQITPTAETNGLTLTHSAGSMEIYGALTPTQTIMIDSIKRYLTIGGIGSMQRLAIESAWPIAVPGQNIFTASAAVTGNVRFQERWI